LLDISVVAAVGYATGADGAAFCDGTGGGGDDKSDNSCDNGSDLCVTDFGAVAELSNSSSSAKKAESWTQHTVLDMYGAGWQSAFP
jgi:hypothetical protein